MGRRGVALALALSVFAGACGATASPTPSPAASASATIAPSAGPSPRPRSPAATPATILAVDLGRRPTGPWIVTFQQAGSESVHEVYVLSLACPEATCDINATIQTYDGIPLGTGVFHQVDGTYRYEADSRDVVDCEDGFAAVENGATQVSHTSLVIAGYRPAGSAVVSVDIRGTRSVAIEPARDSSCPAASLEYVAFGEATRFAAAPTPTPKPPAGPAVPVIDGSFFGSGATVVTYRVSGSSITQIIASIRAHGPWSDWVHARAEAVTRAVPTYRFALSRAGGTCRIAISAKPAVVFRYTITLPLWSRPTGVDQATVVWWAGEIQRVAAHERHHVEIFRTGATRLSDAVTRSTCANVSARLAAIVKDIRVQQCEFDLKEYGAALGLSLASCVNR